MDEEINIVQTVALPVYRARKVCWLAMESLCNQIITHGWELLICEEKHDQQLGEEYFMGYRSRLPNCLNVKYIELPEWVPLAKKWQIMGRTADVNSKSFVLQATDCYSGANRLRLSHEVVCCDKIDWVDFTKGYFYSFALKKLILYDACQSRNLSMTFTTAFARNIPNSNLRIGIDGFLLEALKRWKGNANIQHLNVLMEDGLDTDGFNNISKDRINYFKHVHSPFKETDKTLEDIGLPEYIKFQIQEMSI